MTDLPEVETPRMLLRPLSMADLEPLRAIWTDPAVARHLITRPRTREEVEHLLRSMIRDARRWGMWAIVHKADGTLIGRCGFYAFPTERSVEPELAYFLAKPYWGAGLATEAAQASLRHLFQLPARVRAVAVVRPDNTASRRVLEKIGMRPLGEITVTDVPAIFYGVERTAFRAADAPAPGTAAGANPHRRRPDTER